MGLAVIAEKAIRVTNYDTIRLTRRMLSDNMNNIIECSIDQFQWISNWNYLWADTRLSLRADCLLSPLIQKPTNERYSYGILMVSFCGIRPYVIFIVSVCYFSTLVFLFSYVAKGQVAAD